MYICICNAIRETDLRDTARSTDGDATAAYAKLGKQPNCGQCLVKAAQILEHERELASCKEVAI
ncbi:MAG: (2Fe-2S)-binding protein [Pseudomonadota bacterium]